MTREELKEHCEKQIRISKIMARGKEPSDKIYEEHKMILELLERELNTEQFAKWVATEIFGDMWEYNKDAFTEIACRKLAKLGIVRANGDEWELVEPQKSEVEE